MKQVWFVLRLWLFYFYLIFYFYFILFNWFWWLSRWKLKYFLSHFLFISFISTHLEEKNLQYFLFSNKILKFYFNRFYFKLNDFFKCKKYCNHLCEINKEINNNLEINKETINKGDRLLESIKDIKINNSNNKTLL